MPRAARLDCPDLLQHVIFRGVDRCDIFRDDADRLRFLQNLSRLLVSLGVECLAWSLMTNHVHLLLRPRKSRLAPFMRRFLTGYAIYFNRRHQRAGHLFQNRYKSIVCEEDAYLLELVRYIHLNPLRAGMVADLDALDHYAWSGHGAILGNGSLEGQEVGTVLALFAKDRNEAIRHYRQFVADGVSQGKRGDLTSSGRREAVDADAYDQRILGSGAFVEALRTHPDLAPELLPAVDIRELIVRTCRRFDVVPEDLLRRTRTPGVAEARSVVGYLCVHRLERSGVEVGALLGLSRSGVTMAARRGEQMVAEDASLLELLNY